MSLLTYLFYKICSLKCVFGRLHILTSLLIPISFLFFGLTYSIIKRYLIIDLHYQNRLLHQKIYKINVIAPPDCSIWVHVLGTSNFFGWKWHIWLTILEFQIVEEVYNFIYFVCCICPNVFQKNYQNV